MDVLCWEIDLDPEKANKPMDEYIPPANIICRNSVLRS